MQIKELNKRLIRDSWFIGFGLLLSLITKEKSLVLGVALLLYAWIMGHIVDLIHNI